MFIADPNLTHIAATRGQVVSIIQSLNHPHVGVPGHSTQPGEGTVVGIRNRTGTFSVFVHLYLLESKAAAVYAFESSEFDVETYPSVESEAVDFLESMGFMVDNVNFRNLSPLQQEELMGRLPCFDPNPGAVDTEEAGEADDSGVLELEEVEEAVTAPLSTHEEPDGSRARGARSQAEEIEELAPLEELETLESPASADASSDDAVSVESALRVARLLASF